MSEVKRVLVAGLGNIGRSHALAYQRIAGFDLVGICDPNLSERGVPEALAQIPTFASYDEALAETRPDVVSINTWSDTHADYAIRAMDLGAHVFLEKPIAETVADAQRVVETAGRTGRKLVVGYILRHHPSWQRFIELARTLGTPKVLRMNLNQQSDGDSWLMHKRLLRTLSPIVDCGVHYVDVWCQIVAADAVSVHGVGTRLTDELPPGMYNYGHFEVTFADGSVAWFEAGWGPMMSETAFFIKDAIGPRGSVSIVVDDEGTDLPSADLNTYTRTNMLRLHHAALTEDGRFARPDERISTRAEPSHDDLCEREQRFLLSAIDDDSDLSDHMADAVKSLAIVLAADESIRTGKVVQL